MITEIKNTLEGINSRISEAEELISELKDNMLEITSVEQNKVKRMKKKKTGQSQRPLGQYQMHQHSNYGVTEEEEKKKTYEKIFEDITEENFSNMGQKIVIHVQEAQRVPYKVNP